MPPKKSTAKNVNRYSIIAIGTSLGGLNALETILPALPEDFWVPIVIAQHRLEGSDSNLQMLLQTYCKLKVCEPNDKDPVENGRVYLAPPGYHLLIDEGFFALSIDLRVQYSRPSIDVLFESVSDQYYNRAIGIVLTGANEDGATGLAQIKKNGGLAIVQDPDTAESPIMPRAALAATAVDKVLKVEEIVPYLISVIPRVEVPSDKSAKSKHSHRRR